MERYQSCNLFFIFTALQPYSATFSLLLNIQQTEVNILHTYRIDMLHTGLFYIVSVIASCHKCCSSKMLT